MVLNQRRFSMPACWSSIYYAAARTQPKAVSAYISSVSHLTATSPGMRDKPGKSSDLYHTCYCLSGLSIAINTQQPLAVSDDIEVPSLVCVSFLALKHSLIFRLRLIRCTMSHCRRSNLLALTSTLTNEANVLLAQLRCDRTGPFYFSRTTRPRSRVPLK